jgi:diadenosine tetraphosphate (Ap4A) HIT family hydrolase
MDQITHAENNENGPAFVSGCLFCELPADKFEVVDENELCLTLTDSYPVTEGHCLIIPKRHAETYFDMNADEVLGATQLLHRARERIPYPPDSAAGW